MPSLSMADRTAFCATCPSPDEVTMALASLGFPLVFQMNADDDQAYLRLTPLPAQFHYREPQGAEVIYLAGMDQEDEQPAPLHASRFWFYAGADECTSERATKLLSATWPLTSGEPDA